MPRKALQLPFSREDAAQVGKNLYRKQILPLGKIEHANGTLEVTPEYVADLANNFNGGAFDQVAFLLANSDNSHHMDPEKFRGEVKGLEAGADGLYGLIELTDEGAKVVSDNPALGVSARIIQAAKDGKDAIQHVLGTLDPRAKGMAPWEAVNLSDDDTEVLDLTEAEVVEPTAAASSTEVTPPATKTPEATDLSAEDAERILTEMLERKDEPVVAELSDEQRQSIELAGQRAERAEQRVSDLSAQLAEARYERKRDELIAAGVPPHIVDLAEPVLKGEAKTIELSNGTKIDAGDTVEKILEACKGTIDFSVLGAGAGAEGTEQAEAQRLAKAWAEANGGGN